MIPLRDNIPARTTPFVNYGLIVACTGAFLLQVTAEDPAAIIERYGMIPAGVAGGAARDLLTPLTCIFLHGGWLHFLGNMWFLHIFGDNVEDRYGHLGYLLFYLASGAAASMAHLLTNPGSTIPTIGASGAIAGVMGAYFLLYPRAMVLSLVPIIVYMEIVVLPAPLFLGFWFLLQLLQGAFTIGAAEATGVAWWAHIGGFVVGAGASAILSAFGILRPRVEARRPHTEHMGHYRAQRGRRY